jgi:membrane fusion protein (multidrug efflux system)
VVKEGSAEPAGMPSASVDAGAAVAADAPPPQEPTLTVERRFVHVGPAEQGRVAILDGVKAGEQVVTSGQLKLHPGATVKIDNADALKPPAVMPKQ